MPTMVCRPRLLSSPVALLTSVWCTRAGHHRRLPEATIAREGGLAHLDKDSQGRIDDPGVPAHPRPYEPRSHVESRAISPYRLRREPRRGGPAGACGTDRVLWQ